MSNQQLEEQIIFLKNQLIRCREDVKKKTLHNIELIKKLKRYSVPSLDVNKPEEKNLTQSSDESVLSYYSDSEFEGGKKKKTRRKNKTRRKKKPRKKKRKSRKKKGGFDTICGSMKPGGYSYLYDLYGGPFTIKNEGKEDADNECRLINGPKFACNTAEITSDTSQDQRRKFRGRKVKGRLGFGYFRDPRYKDRFDSTCGLGSCCLEMTPQEIKQANERRSQEAKQKAEGKKEKQKQKKLKKTLDTLVKLKIQHKLTDKTIQKVLTGLPLSRDEYFKALDYYNTNLRNQLLLEGSYVDEADKQEEQEKTVIKHTPLGNPIPSSSGGSKKKRNKKSRKRKKKTRRKSR